MRMRLYITRKKMFWRDTEYRLARMDQFTVFDEFGCIVQTRNKTEMVVFICRQFLPRMASDGGNVVTTGKTTDLNCTVMCFFSGIGIIYYEAT